jgi:hypothetical protein
VWIIYEGTKLCVKCWVNEVSHFAPQTRWETVGCSSSSYLLNILINDMEYTRVCHKVCAIYFLKCYCVVCLLLVQLQAWTLCFIMNQFWHWMVSCCI